MWYNTPIMAGTESPNFGTHNPDTRDESLLASLENHVVRNVSELTQRVLPEYSRIDRSRYDSYDLSQDNYYKTGKILTLRTEQGATPSDPYMEFVFRLREGAVAFNINYYNSSEPSHPYSIRNAGNAVFGPKDRMWKMDEVDFALQKAQIHMRGVDLNDPDFRNHPAGWFEGRPITFGERLDAKEQYSSARKASEKQAIQPFYDAAMVEVWDYVEHTPEVATNIAVVSVAQHPTYTFEGKEYTTEEIADQIQQGSELGKQVMLKELYHIEAYERLLYDHRKLEKLKRPPKPKKTRRG